MSEGNKRTKQTVKPELPSGFRDALPEDMIAKQRMLDTIRSVFERFGFDPMATPAVERTEVLIGGEANSKKIIFNVQGSEEKLSDTSLRFDLTVPLARVLAANPEIPRPFKRYQINEVWRGERPKAGRYREFTQADIDIVGVRSLDADAEIIQVMYETLKALSADGFVVRLNDRAEAEKILQQFGVAEEKQRATLIAVDKKDKLGPDEWAKEVGRTSGLDTEKLQKYLWELSGENMLEASNVRLLREKAVSLGVPQTYLRYDASLVRGLDYYTGAIFEAVLTDMLDIGSVFSGGRFDGLTARFSREAVPAVGASLGVDRLLTALEKLGKIKKQKTLVKVMVLNLSPDLAPDYSQILKNLRIVGISSTLYLGDDRSFQAQFAYAVKEEIPFIVIYGDKEKASGAVQVKDLRQEKQEAVDFPNLTAYLKSHLEK